MDKLLTLMFALFLTGTAQAVEVNFGDPIDVQLNISSITMSATGMVITYEGSSGTYGLIHATHNMTATKDDNTKGYFTGTVQAIRDNGTMEQVTTVGLWKRQGRQLRVYGFDDDDAARILHISDVNMQTKKFEAKVWELDK